MVNIFSLLKGKTLKFSFQKILVVILGFVLFINIVELGFYFYLRFYSSRFVPYGEHELSNSKTLDKSLENMGKRPFSNKYVGFLGIVEEKGVDYFVIANKKGKVKVNVDESTVIKKPNFSQPLHVNPVYNLQWAPNLGFEAIEKGQIVDVVGISQGKDINALSIVIDDSQEF